METQEKKFLFPPIPEDNVFLEDPYLQRVLRTVVPTQYLNDIEQDLARFGKRVGRNGDVYKLDKRARETGKEPRLRAYNAWGERVDELVVCDEWRDLHQVSQDEKLLELGYLRRSGPYSRLHQFVKLYLFAGTSAIVTCPLAMSDGAIKLVEQLQVEEHQAKEKGKENSQKPLPAEVRAAQRKLVRGDWTSGQWMTERAGGSDLSNSQTIAKKEADSASAHHLLYGYKFFTSATTSQMAFTLARLPGAKTLSLFYLELRDQQGKLNNITIHRLKEKFGTKPLPTAELELKGTPAILVGEEGAGIRTIAHLINVTRIYVSMSSSSSMRRLLHLLRDYSSKRMAYGKKVLEQPAHLATLADLETTSRGCFLLFIKQAELLGHSEVNCPPLDTAGKFYSSFPQLSPQQDLKRKEAELLLRLLTPVAKLFTANKTMEVVTEALCLFGAPGYMEDTLLPRFLTDSMVNCIWEGTTNILSLDLLRILYGAKTQRSFELLCTSVEEMLAAEVPGELSGTRESLTRELTSLKQFVLQLASQTREEVESRARALAFTIGRVYVGALLFEFASKTKNSSDIYAAQRWVSKNNAPCPSCPCVTESLAAPLPLNSLRELGLNAKL